MRFLSYPVDSEPGLVQVILVATVAGEVKGWTSMTGNIRQAKEYVAHHGGLRSGESLADALARLPDIDEARELSRMKSVMQVGRSCHDCSCHLMPPCQQCVECEVCNDDESM